MWKKLSKMMSRALGATTAGPGRGQRRPRRFRPALEGLEARAVPATFTVTTTLDTVAPDGRLSLREAVSAANAHPGADTIVVPAGVYRLSLRGADDTNAAGDLDVSGTTLFLGAGAGATVIDGQRIDRVFDVLGTAPHSTQVAFQGLTVRNGLADAGGGGGIRVGNADLVVRGCVVTGNRTAGDGGGIANAALPGTGNVTLVRSVVSRNVAGGEGGGLDVRSDSFGQGSVLNVGGSTIQGNIARTAGGILAFRLNLTGCTVSGNRATVGGGISASTPTLTSSTVSGNQATNGDGGGIDARTATLTSSTVSGNSANGAGGGINAAALTLLGVTVTNNSAHAGGGVFLQNGGTSSVGNSTIADNLVDLGGVGPDLSGAFTSAGHNLIGDASGSTGFVNATNGDQVGTAANPIDPRLAPGQ
jgi:CSLREA domain-containing protein